MNEEFWDYLQRLVETSKIIIDRPKGSSHPRFDQADYPASYGYLEGTSAMDGAGVDIWIGSLTLHKVVGVICSVDLLKKDTELKILYDCSDEDVKTIVQFMNHDQMRAKYIKRDV